ncbi:AAA family ATPase [Nakamurella lactea]|uniref:AAA family ATPase n=1 Tax=Nakamurella lactea TaxID=459515 RepID=UPI0003F82EB8|nr:helix-turn-helix transcriptional regulator [Nakamurella lactea]
MLVGRTAETGAIDALVAGARVGSSGILLITGEPGIGKSTLIEYARTRIHDMRLLTARGSAAERDLPFGGLLQVLRPALALIDRIPAPQAEALGVALALRAGHPVDRFAVGAATLSLLTLLGEDRPVAVLIDDGHELDQPSAQAIAFAARRLFADPILVVVAARGEPLTVLTTSGLPELRLTGIDREASRTLVAATATAPTSAETTRQILELSRGNPLAIIELAREGAVLTATRPDAPMPIPADLAARFAARADSLSPDARLAVLLVATAGGDLPLVAKACATMDVAIGALAEAERAALLRVGAERVEFVHPLVRSGIYATSAPELRRSLHAAVAQALPATDDRRAWHLCDAALGPDPEAADAIAEVARRAADRGAHAVASIGYERAAGLTADGPARAGRLLAAATAAWSAGDATRARSLLAATLELEPTPPTRWAANGLLGTIAARCGPLDQARQTLLLAAADATDVDRALVLFADAIYGCFYLGDSATALATSAHVEQLLRDPPGPVAPLAGTIAAIATGVAQILAGQLGIDRIHAAVEQLSTFPDAESTQPVWSMIGPLFLRESSTGRRLARRVVDSGRARSDVGTLPHLLFLIARDGAATDRWAPAAADYAESIELARDFGHTTDLGLSLSGLAWLEARMGRAADCRAHMLEAMEVCTQQHIHLGRAWAQFAAGELATALGRPEQAATTFRELSQWLDDNGILDVDVDPGPELVDALLRLGRADEAAQVAHRYHRRAVAKGQPWALARAERVLGMVGRPTADDRHFTAALEAHAVTLDAFETARTQLAYGSRLRRERRRVDARVQLRSALGAFEQLGAVPWAELTRSELLATGERVGPRGADPAQQLTPQEMQISLLLADGRTTREAAAALFLSPKTVEYHLRHVYTKLGIRSRTELAAQLRDVDR